MLKQNTPPTEYSAPRIEVLEIVTEQVFANSTGTFGINDYEDGIDLN